jgi:hypothetical protein
MLSLFNTDYVVDPSNYEALRFEADKTYYQIRSNVNGAGLLRPIYLSANGTTTHLTLSTG